MSNPDDSTEDIFPTRRHRPNGNAPQNRPKGNPASIPEADLHSAPELPGYQILGLIGSGSAGRVYKGVQLALNRVVAIKVVSSSALMAADLLRSRQEAQAVACLQHPNIIQVFEIGSSPAGPYLILEYVDGGTLKQKIAGTPQPIRESARIVETLARAVQHAHERRLIHRDLKPGNVLLTTDGLVKIADFGLAQPIDAEGGMAAPDSFVGTAYYAAPELVTPGAGRIGPGVDVYALGVTLYELLTGRVPFVADTVPAVLALVLTAEPISPRQMRPEVSRDLETICLKCIQKDPLQRYATAAALAEDLLRFQTGLPIHARPIGAFERAIRWTRRNPVVTALLGAVFGLLTFAAVGATIAAFRIENARQDAHTNAIAATRAAAEAEHERDIARIAVREGKEKLLQSLISEARASRFSRRVGQRFNTLDAIRKATTLAQELEKPTKTYDELRNLAIAALVLPDLKPAPHWVSTPTDRGNGWAAPHVDPTYRYVVVNHFDGTVSLRRVGTNPDNCGEIVRLPRLGSEVNQQWTSDGRFLGIWHWQEPVRRLQVWRVGDGELKVMLDLPKACDGFTFTPDGQQVVAIIVPDNTLGDETFISTIAGPLARVYDIESAKLLHSIPLPEGVVHHVAHHPTRSELAIGLGDRVAIIDLTNGNEINSDRPGLWGGALP